MPYLFPTLSVTPSVESWEEGVAFDPTITSQSEGGYKQTRPSSTRIPDKWSIGYVAAPAADKDLVRAFEKTVKVGSEIFDALAIFGVSKNVRFAGPVKYKMNTNKSWWDILFVIEEA
ncbi:MAG: hypothetical protein M1510_10660 [Nitrospirae bacterium]|nr:hypothetical protein [Nitrospirota bacterium]MCL5237404.1 hypothetical protein [Nitrospirota bacterium]